MFLSVGVSQTSLVAGVLFRMDDKQGDESQQGAHS